MILVTGANGVVGRPLCQRLDAQGLAYLKVSRQTNEADDNFLQWKLPEPLSARSAALINARRGTVDTLMHCAPIWLLPDVVPELAALGIKRMLVFSSTSVIGKQTSGDVSEQRLVNLLSAAEQALQSQAAEHSLQLTIFRPSMIYGYGRDENISRIAGLLQRLPIMPLAGRAQGLRQPVHADDLVSAMLSARQQASTIGKIYNLAGGEKITYREMVERIGQGLSKRVRFLHLPVWLYRVALWAAAKMGRFSYTADMANRMNQDLVYDYAPAVSDFGYAPQAFLQQPQRDLLPQQSNDMQNSK